MSIGDSEHPVASERHLRGQGMAVSAVVVAALLALANYIGGRLWFFSDDWNIFAGYHSGNLLEPFNGHLSLVPAGLYQLVFRTLGVDSYSPFRYLGLAALAFLGYQVLRYANERVGPWITAVALAAIFWNSFGATNVLFPFLMNFTIPIACLVAIWWHLDQNSEGEAPSQDVFAAIWFAVALATSGLGLIVAVAVGVELLWQKSQVRRYVPFAAVGALWFLWWLTHRESTDFTTDVFGALEFAARMIWGGTTALAAGWRPGGVLLAVALVGLFVFMAVKHNRVDARVIGALSAPFAFAVVTGFTRLNSVPPIPPDELRYGWTIGALIVLAVVSLAKPGEAAATPTEPFPRSGVWSTWPARAAIGAVLLLIVLGGVQLVRGMHAWGDQVAEAAPGLRSVLYATEAVGPSRIDGERVIPLSYVPVTAGGYLGAVADIGSPLEGATAEMIGGSEDSRAAADRILFEYISPEPLPSGAPLNLDTPTCDVRIETPPGSVVAPDAGDGAEKLGVSRFTDKMANEFIAPFGLQILPDEPVGTNAAVPYVVESASNGVVCSAE